MDFEASPHMLFVRNSDKPGFIGRLGTLLGEAGVNIATFSLGRERPGGDAICLVAVDAPVDDTVLAREGAAACRAGAPARVLTLLAFRERGGRQGERQPLGTRMLGAVVRRCIWRHRLGTPASFSSIGRGSGGVKN